MTNHPRRITSVSFAYNLGSTPARSKRSTGQLWLNAQMWPRIPEEHRKYIILHEEGHIVLNTSDELAADRYASGKYLSGGGSLTQSISALREWLTFSNPEHYLRLMEQEKRAIWYDCHINGNDDMCRLEQKQKPNKMSKVVGKIQQAYEDKYLVNDDFLGFGKKDKEKREERRKEKEERKDKKQEQKIEKLKAGGGFGNFLKNLGAGAASVLGAMSGAGGGQSTSDAGPPSDPNAAPLPQQKSKTGLIIAIVAVVIIITVVVIIVIKKKK